MKALFEENPLLISSNSNWNEFIKDIEFDGEKPNYVSNDPLTTFYQPSLKLLDNKDGIFFCNERLGLIAISLGFSWFRVSKYDQANGIHIRSFFLKDKKFHPIKRILILSDSYNEFEKYKSTSAYARSAIIKLSKAKSIEEFKSMMDEIRKIRKNFCLD